MSLVAYHNLTHSRNQVATRYIQFLVAGSVRKWAQAPPLSWAKRGDGYVRDTVPAPGQGVDFGELVYGRAVPDSHSLRQMDRVPLCEIHPCVIRYAPVIGCLTRPRWCPRHSELPGEETHLAAAQAVPTTPDGRFA